MLTEENVSGFLQNPRSESPGQVKQGTCEGWVIHFRPLATAVTGTPPKALLTERHVFLPSPHPNSGAPEY